MKKFFRKIKNDKGPASPKTASRGGFALLFAVLTASLLLSIGLSIFSLTVKELSLSSYSRESQFSFYAADSGAECALYWDIRGNSGTTFATSTSYNGVSPYKVYCGNALLSLNEQSHDNSDATTTFNMLINDTGTQISCAIVTVAKYDNNGDGLSNTTIDSRGYNVCNGTAASVQPTWGNPNLVERALLVSY